MARAARPPATGAYALYYGRDAPSGGPYDAVLAPGGLQLGAFA